MINFNEGRQFGRCYGGRNENFDKRPLCIADYDRFGKSSKKNGEVKGYCHAAGAILDGEMISAGRSDRGARYNSIANYVSWVLKKWEKEKGEKYFCFAAIISEDEMVNLIFPKRDGS